MNLDNFIPAARGYPELFSYAFLRRESGENVKGYRWEAPFAGKITNYLLRLKCLILIKTVISINGDDSRYHVAVLRFVQVPPYACAVINELVSVTDKVVREVVSMIG